MIIKSSLMLAVIALATIGSIYVLGVFENAAVQQALGKVFALLGIFTGSALAIAFLANTGKPMPSSDQHPRF